MATYTFDINGETIVVDLADDQAAWAGAVQMLSELLIAWDADDEEEARIEVSISTGTRPLCRVRLTGRWHQVPNRSIDSSWS